MSEISVKKNLTGETLDLFLEKLSKGVSLTGACAACGISAKRVDQLRKEKPKFNAQVLAAQARAEGGVYRQDSRKPRWEAGIVFPAIAVPALESEDGWKRQFVREEQYLA